MYKNNIVVPINNGIHTRIAAMIVHKATEIKNKYGLDLYIKRMDSREPYVSFDFFKNKET